MIKFKLRKLLKVPEPQDLGFNSALPLRSFTPWEKSPCWEDYYDLLREKYPVRYWLTETAPDFIKTLFYYPIIVPIKDAWYWLKCHTLPSKKYHLLDLRQPCQKNEIKNIDCYQYGWCDVPEKMLYAMFNLLKEYFDEEPYDLTTNYTQEEIDADFGLKEQQNHYEEAKAILHWWQVERKQEIEQYYQLLSQWSDGRKDDIVANDPVTAQNWKILIEAEEQMERKTDEMIARLMKIRRGLWT